MRAPKRKRPQRRELRVPPDVNLDSLTNLVTYEGSPEHKDTPSFAGLPQLRADASCCPRDIKDVEMVCGWLRDAIRRGATGAFWEEGLPRYVWYKRGDTVFEGRLINRGAGSYKEYPLEREEWPKGIEELYADA